MTPDYDWDDPFTGFLLLDATKINLVRLPNNTTFTLSGVEWWLVFDELITFLFYADFASLSQPWDDLITRRLFIYVFDLTPYWCINMLITQQQKKCCGLLLVRHRTHVDEIRSNTSVTPGSYITPICICPRRYTAVDDDFIHFRFRLIFATMPLKFPTLAIHCAPLLTLTDRMRRWRPSVSWRRSTTKLACVWLC